MISDFERGEEILDIFSFHILTFLTFFPLVGIVLVVAASIFSKGSHAFMRFGALGVSILEFLFSLPLFFKFDLSSGGYQFEERSMWLADIGISYHLGVDGISLFLILLTTFITPLAILCSWNSIKRGMREFLCLLLFLETALVGTFVSLDMVLFFVFWEAVLIPMYFIIGIWGTERRIYAAIKFFIYTALGSAFMLVAILYLYYSHIAQFGFPSMDLRDLYNVRLPFEGILSPQGLCFLAFFLAFAIKAPMFPFHTWLPDAHVEAPTAGSLILAGVLLKMGTYGFLRFVVPMFPEATVAYAPILIFISIVGIIYGAMVAFAQTDLKKLVAYSSVSHMGLIMLGIFVLNIQGVDGSVYQMVSHGLSTGALFLLVGMIYDRRKTKKLDQFGGIASVMPLYAVFFMLATLSSIGLPLLNGFVGEFLVLLGAFRENVWYSAFAATGLILGAVYMLWAYQKVMFGPLDKLSNKVLKDLNFREILIMSSLSIMFLIMGIYPKPFMERIESGVGSVLIHHNNTVSQNSIVPINTPNTVFIEDLRDRLSKYFKRP